MAKKTWRVTLNISPEEKADYELYKNGNRLNGSNASVLKDLAFQAIYSSVKQSNR